MKTHPPLLALFIGCIVMVSCAKEKTDTVTITKIDTVNHINTITRTDTLNLNITDTIFQLSADTISALLDGSPYFLTTYSSMSITTTPGWQNNPIEPSHEFAIQAQDSTINDGGDLIVLTIFTTDSCLVPNKTYGAIGDNTSNALISYYNHTFVGYNYGTGFGFETASTQGPTSATITSITGDEITGTFQGTIFYNNDTTSSNKKVLSNGEFKAFFN